MKSRSNAVGLAIFTVALATILTASAVPAAAPTYTVSAIGPEGGAYRPVAVNTVGQIVGRDGSGRPFFVDSGITYHPIPPLGSTCWALTGLNASGRVVGYIKSGAHCTAPVEAITGMISRADINFRTLANAGGVSAAGCAALSVNDSGEIAGVCDAHGASRPVIWRSTGQGYGGATMLPLPRGTAALPAMRSRPPVLTRAIDADGDVIGQARCAEYGHEPVAVVWSAVGHASLLPGPRTGPCHTPAARSVPTRAASIASATPTPAGPPGVQVFVAGLCRASGVGTTQKNRPCLWKLIETGGSLRMAKPTILDGAASRYARATDVNADDWIVGARGNRANTTTLWVPAGSGHARYSLTALANSLGWIMPGPCDDSFGAAALAANGSVVGTGEESGRGTGFLMQPAPSTHGIRRLARSRTGVSGSGCQS